MFRLRDQLYLHWRTYIEIRYRVNNGKTYMNYTWPPSQEALGRGGQTGTQTMTHCACIQIKVQHRVLWELSRGSDLSVVEDTFTHSTSMYWAPTIPHTFFPSLRCARQSLGIQVNKTGKEEWMELLFMEETDDKPTKGIPTLELFCFFGMEDFYSNCWMTGSLLSSLRSQLYCHLFNRPLSWPLRLEEAPCH